MWVKDLLGILMLFLFAFIFISCDKENEEGRKVTGYKEYVLTVASEKILGTGWSDGFNYLSDVYAVKKDDTKDWEALVSIDGFEFEEGYEYKIKISGTSYLDYRMGQPAWTEYDLLEILSKEKRDSKDLPSHLIPKWYYEEQPLPMYRYAVEADNKAVVEEDLKTYPILPLDYHYLLYSGFDEEYLGKWIAIKDDTNVWGPGLIKGINRNSEEIPEIYNLMPPEGQVQAFMEWSFLDESGNETNYPSFDVFLGCSTKSGSAGPTPDLYFYKDLTEYYKEKYPDGGVKAVVVSYIFKF